MSFIRAGHYVVSTVCTEPSLDEPALWGVLYLFKSPKFQSVHRDRVIACGKIWGKELRLRWIDGYLGNTGCPGQEKWQKKNFYEMRSCSFFVVWCWLCAYIRDLNSPWRCCNPMQNQYISLESQHIRRDSCAMNSSSKFGTLWSGGSCIFLSHY